jgi:transposase
MTYETRRYIVECYFGKSWHFEKIADSIYKKFDMVISISQIEEFVKEIDQYLRKSNQESPKPLFREVC